MLTAPVFLMIQIPQNQQTNNYNINQVTDTMQLIIQQQSHLKYLSQDENTSRDNTDFINKNQFLISYDGFDIDEETEIIVNDLKWLIDNLARAKKLGKNQEVKQYQILERKLGRTCKRYKALFYQWLKVDPPESFSFNSQESLSKQQKKKEAQKQLLYWSQPISQMIKLLRKPDLSIQKFRQMKNKRKRTQKEDEEDLQSTQNNSDLSWEYDAEPGPLDQNLHLQNLIQHISEDLFVYVYLPSLLKITIVGINEIDQVNERASIILKLELKIKLPENADDESDLFRHLSKLKLHVKSKKMKNQEENIGTFLRKPGQPEQQNSLFYGNSIENDEDAPFSIWTQFKDYYTANNKFMDKTNEEVKKILNKLTVFEGAIFSGYLKDVQVKINSYSLNAPFQILDLNGFVTIEEIETKIKEWQDDIYQYINYDLSLSPKIVIKPNLVGVGQQEHIEHIVNSSPQIFIDEYQLAERLIKIQISHSDKSNIILKNGICGWEWVQKEERQFENGPMIVYPGDFVCHFHFPIYRHPFKSLGGMFIPTFVLGIINLFIFFQNATKDGLGQRIANIATLLISFVAMITVIQSQIKRQVLTVASILIHLTILTPLLCMIQTMYLYFIEAQEAEPLTSILFWICVFITALNLLYPAIFYFTFKVIWEPGFNLQEIRQSSILLPGDNEIDQFNSIEKRQYYPIKSLSSANKIGVWEKSLSDFLKKTLAQSLENPRFQKAIRQISRLYPRFHGFLSGGQGKIYQDILLSKKRSYSL